MFRLLTSFIVALPLTFVAPPGTGVRGRPDPVLARTHPIFFKADRPRSRRSKDVFIAYAGEKSLRPGDERWRPRLPMTKSAVRAMDAVTAFTSSREGGGA